MPTLEKKHFDAAAAMAEVFAKKLGQDRAVHSETAIAAAARMAGTMLLRSFGLNTATMPPGAVILSEQANEKGPQLIEILGAALRSYGLHPNRDEMEKLDERGEPPQMSVNEMQLLLEPDLTRIREQHALDLEEGAHACALVAAWMIRECTPQVGLEVGLRIAIHGFIEGSKTVPIAQSEPGGRVRSGLSLSRLLRLLPWRARS